MPNTEYICAKCGLLRRAPIVYFPVISRKKLTYEEALSQATASPSWPKHCQLSMKCLSDEQGEAASRLSVADRIKWLARGLLVVKRGGRHTWEAAVSDYQVKKAEQQMQLAKLRSASSP